MIGLVCALFSLAQIAITPTGNATVSGEIRQTDGLPARAVRVTATPVGEPSTFASIAETDASGLYRLENIPPGRYYISAGILEQPTYFPGVAGLRDASVVTLDAGAALRGINLRLVRAGGVRIVGRLAESDPEVRGLRLYAVDGREPMQTATLKPDRSFEFVRVPPGQYSISVDGFFPYAVWSSLPLDVANKEIQGVELKLVPYVRIAGRATVPDDGPVPEFGLTLQGPLGWLRTRAVFMNREDGSFNVGLPVGEFRVIADVLTAGYRIDALAYQGTNVLHENVRVTGQVGQFAARFSLTGAPPWRRIRGRVTGLRNIPVWTGPLRVDLSLDSVGFWGEATVNADGSFEFPEVLPGNYLILPPGLRSTRLVVGGSDIEDLTFHVPTHREVTGVVVWENAETPQSFDVVFVSPEGSEYYSSRTASSFRAILPEGEFEPQFIIPAGYVVASVMQTSRDLRRETLRVSEKNEPIRVVLRAAQRPVRVRGRSLLPAPTNGGSREVALLGPGIQMRTTMNKDGSFEFAGVPPGEYTVTVSSFATTTLVVGAQDVADVEIRPIEHSYVRARISTEDGSVPPQASLLFEPVNSGTNTSSMRISAAEVEWQTEVVSGTYRLASVDVPRNRYRVEWVRRGAVDLFQEAMTLIPSKPGSAIPDGDTIEVRVSLLPAKPFRKVSGRFLGADIPSIVSLNDSDGGSAQSAVDSNGNFEFERVSPGIHRLYAGGSYLDPAPTTIAVTDDDVLNVGVTVPGQREIRGRVHIEGGGTLPPLALLVWHEWTLGQLNVGLTPRGGQGVPLTIFADGAFEISMPEGSHRIEVTGFPAAFYRLISVDFGGSDVLKGRLTVTGTTLPELLIKLQLVDADIMAGLHGKLRATTGSRPNRVALSGQNPQLASLKLFATLLQDGSYNFERVPAGTYSLGTDPPVAGMLPRHVTLQASQTAEADLNVPAIIRTKVSVRAEGRQLADPRITFTIRLNTGEAYRVYPSPVFTYVQPLGTRCLGDVCSYRPSGAHLNEPAGVLGSNTAGSFDMLLPEGDHRIEIDTAPQGFRLKSALQGDIDLLKSPLRIGNGPAEILLTVE